MADMRTQQGNRLGCLLKMILVIGALVPNCQSAPSFNPRSSWRDDNNVPVLESDCDPTTGRCWGWLPVADSRLDDYANEEDTEFNRVQPIHVRNVDHVPSYAIDDVETKNTLPLNSNQAPNRFAKKDVFASRGWGAGGMPFSVLYMSPRANHPQPSGSTDSSKNTDQSKKNHNNDSSAAASPLSSSSAAAQTAARTNRVTPRNGGYNQPRRHYSIIPQLFISYGWGPSGK